MGSARCREGQWAASHFLMLFSTSPLMFNTCSYKQYSWINILLSVTCTNAHAKEPGQKAETLPCSLRQWCKQLVYRMAVSSLAFPKAIQSQICILQQTLQGAVLSKHRDWAINPTSEGPKPRCWQEDTAPCRKHQHDLI